ncbi:MAG TPA: histidine phosphatase family protein [Micromonosporaceae bacterium]|jgi:probable phosphoglycerate mutase
MGELVLIRHGETAWTISGQHTGHTDIALTADGESQARDLGRRLQGRRFLRSFTSPRIRARRTAELAGLTDAQVDERLVEWDYGGYEGMTADQIADQRGGQWSLWADGVVPGSTPGESMQMVYDRATGLLVSLRPFLEHGDVALVAHGHILRVIAASWLCIPGPFGANLSLSPASICVLGTERDGPVISLWNETGKVP